MKKFKERRASMLAHAVTAAMRKHYSTITREDIAAQANCAVGLVSYYLGPMQSIRRDIIRQAIASGNLRIISQGLGNGDVYARKAPDPMKAEALKLLAR